MPGHLLVLMSNAVNGKDEEYNRWYDQHLADTVATHPGFVSGRRFRRPDLQGMPAHKYRYVAIYEIADDQLNEAYEYFINRRRDRDLAEKEGRIALSPVPTAVDLDNASVAFFTQIGPNARRAE